MIVRFFYYYHLNLICDSSWFDLIRGNMILLIKYFNLNMIF